MLFVDFVFDLLPCGSIRFDSGLKSDQINVKDGDEFVANVIDQKITFVKRRG